MYNLHCGVDIGGSHISVGLVDGDGSLLLVVDHQLLNNSTILADDIVGIIYDLISQVTYMLVDGNNDNASDIGSGHGVSNYNRTHLNRIATVGIGCPGQCKNGVLVASSNLPLLAHAPLAAKLSALLDGLPVTLVNDADAAVAAEVWSKETTSEYRDCQHVAMITLGTGIGLGLVLNRQLYHGASGLIEGGHMIIASPEMPSAFPQLEERPCGCGQTNCVECFASAKSLAKRYLEAKQLPDPTFSPPSGSINAKFVFHQAASGDQDAERVVNDAARSLAILVVNLCRVLDPDVIIFGGGMAHAGEPFMHRIRAHLKNLSWKILPTNVKLVLAKSMNEAGILGAAMAGKHARGIECESQVPMVERVKAWLPAGGVTLMAAVATLGLLLWRRASQA